MSDDKPRVGFLFEEVPAPREDDFNDDVSFWIAVIILAACAVGGVLWIMTHHLHGGVCNVCGDQI